MLKWIILVVVVVAYPLEVGHLIAELASLAKDTINAVIIGYNR